MDIRVKKIWWEDNDLVMETVNDIVFRFKNAYFTRYTTTYNNDPNIVLEEQHIHFNYEKVK